MSSCRPKNRPKNSKKWPFLHTLPYIFDLNFIFFYFFFSTGLKIVYRSFGEMYFQISNPNPQIKGRPKWSQPSPEILRVQYYTVKHHRLRRLRKNVGCLRSYNNVRLILTLKF